MGTRQYGDTMSQAKRQSHTAKAAASTSAILGVRISGMQVYHPVSDQYTCHNKYYGRSLTVDGFHQALYNFLHDGVKLRLNVIAALLEKLRKLHSVVQNLNTFRFYTSSLLIIYDGKNEACRDPKGVQLETSENAAREKVKDPLAKSKVSLPSSPPGKNSTLDDQISRRSLSVVDLCMIDYAHSTHNDMPDSAATHEGPDEGYLFGLENLITHLEIIKRTQR